MPWRDGFHPSRLIRKLLSSRTRTPKRGKHQVTEGFCVCARLHHRPRRTRGQKKSDDVVVRLHYRTPGPTAATAACGLHAARDGVSGTGIYPVARWCLDDIAARLQINETIAVARLIEIHSPVSNLQGAAHNRRASLLHCSFLTSRKSTLSSPLPPRLLANRHSGDRCSRRESIAGRCRCSADSSSGTAAFPVSR